MAGAVRPALTGTHPGGAISAKSPKSVTTAVNMSGTPAGSVGSGVQVPPSRRSMVAVGRLAGPRRVIVTPPLAWPLIAPPLWLVREKR